MSITGQNADM